MSNKQNTQSLVHHEVHFENMWKIIMFENLPFETFVIGDRCVILAGSGVT